MGKSPRNSQGRSIARRMESSGGRRKEKGTGLVPGTKKHGGLFSDDAIASFDELLNSDDNTFRTAPGPPVSRAPPPEPDPNAMSSGMSAWIPSALRTASSGRWLSWINVVMLVVLLCGAGVAYVYVGGSEWTEPMEADMMYADTADMVESGNGGVGTPPSPKDIIEEYRRKRLAKEAKEAEERETRLKAARDTPLIEPTPTPLPEPDPMPTPSPTPEVMAPPPRRAMKPKPKSTAAMSGRKGGGKTSGPVSSGEEEATTTTRPRGETDAERTARYAREDAEREARIKAEDEERAARIEEEETAARARVEELAAEKAPEVVEEAVVEEEEAPVVEEDTEEEEEEEEDIEEEERPAPVARKKKREAPAAAGNLGVDYE